MSEEENEEQITQSGKSHLDSNIWLLDLLLFLLLPNVKGNITRTKLPHVMGPKGGFLE